MITVSDLVCVNHDGYVTKHGAQLPINTSGFLIRTWVIFSLSIRRQLTPGETDSAIHKARPDINAAAHCHSLHGKAWSVFGKKIDILTQDACLFYDNLVRLTALTSSGVSLY